MDYLNIQLFKLKNLSIPFVSDHDLPENHTWKRRIPQNLQHFLGIIDINRTKYIRNDCLPAVAAFHMFGLKVDKSTFEDLYYSDFLDYPLSHYDYAASVDDRIRTYFELLPSGNSRTHSAKLLCYYCEHSSAPCMIG